jgi:hypothetical protein
VCPESAELAASNTLEAEWPSEKAVVTAAVSQLRMTTQHDSVILEEFRTSFGLPDILHLRYDPEKLEARMRTYPHPRIPITRDSARLISLLTHNGPLTEPDAVQLLSFTTRRFRAAIAPLLKRNLVIDEHGELRIRGKDDVFFLNRVVVYEAKLKNWPRALLQAQRHLWFADEAFVLMPELSDRVRSRLIPACETAGVGLATLQREGLSIILKADHNDAGRNWLTWYLNETVLDIKCLDANAV